MASKYAAILPNLPELPAQDPSWQGKVDLFKKQLIDDPEFPKNPSELAHEYISLRAEKDRLESEVSRLNLQIEGISQMLVESNDDPEWGKYGASPNMLRLETGDKIEIRKEPYATVEDKDKNREWAIENGLERLLSLPWQTLNSLTKERLLKGEAEPDGVKTFVKTKIVFTAMKHGNE